jgi:sensor histidine kinase YesM
LEATKNDTMCLVLLTQLSGIYGDLKYDSGLFFAHQELQVAKTELRNQIKVYTLIAVLVASSIIDFILLRNIRLNRRKDQLQHLMTEANAKLKNRRKEQQPAEVQQQKTELEMQTLRAQMNPHFIFNSLNSINRFILKKQSGEATEYLTKFSRLMRIILNSSSNASVVCNPG